MLGSSRFATVMSTNRAGPAPSPRRGTARYRRISGAPSWSGKKSAIATAQKLKMGGRG